MQIYDFTMIEQSFIQQIIQNIPFKLSEDQTNALLKLQEFFEDPSPYSIFVLRGYAGTGKTSLISALVNAMHLPGLSITLMAPTGRSAKVLSNYSGLQSYTIHRVIYQATAALPEEGGSFSLAPGGRRGSLFVVDEASMIGSQGNSFGLFGSGDLLGDLLSFASCTEGSRLILVGDSAQLPPVGEDNSPALDISFLEGRYGLKVYHYTMKEILRQKETSGILYNATTIRNLLEGENTPKINCHFNDTHQISGAELIDAIDTSYRNYGLENVMIICYSNKRALAYNLGIRSQILDFEEEIVRGERLVVTRNNYHYATKKDRTDFLANGEIIETTHLGSRIDLYNRRFCEAEIFREDENREQSVTLLLDSLTSETAQMTGQEREAFYNEVMLDYQEITSIVKQREELKKNPYWNALEVKYAYALTCHKAQGGQWPCIFIDMGLMSIIPSDANLIRWLYTAITRAEKEVIFVNTPKEMVEP
ncbi:MAG: AAA family ATPase [Porphyromonadaceae bacterium]|nr:AAA family ATPase [Porphyromonadaceae bacterium]